MKAMKVASQSESSDYTGESEGPAAKDQVKTGIGKPFSKPPWMTAKESAEAVVVPIDVRGVDEIHVVTTNVFLKNGFSPNLVVTSHVGVKRASRCIEGQRAEEGEGGR